MKELSIEEKAKRYDEALKVLHKYDGANIMFSQSLKEEMFPELKESENLRIIKAIKYGLDHVFTNNTNVFEVTKEQCLAWLEKQGKQKLINSTLEEKDKMDDAFTKMMLKDEQKIAKWSEEDEETLKCISCLLTEQSRPDYNGSTFWTKEQLVRWNNWLNARLKSLRPQNRWKPSERQKEALLWCVVHLGGADKQTLGELLEELNKL